MLTGPSCAECRHCGAPDDGERVYCRYCTTPYSVEAVHSAIPCPTCRTANRWGRQQCAHCKGWIVVQCVFCRAISPCHMHACASCGEVFAGSQERKMARAADAANRETWEQASSAAGTALAVGGIAIGVLDILDG